MAVKASSLKPGDVGRLLAESTGMTEKEVLRVAKTAELDALARDEGAVWVKSGATMKNFRIYADMLYNHMADDPQAPLYRGKPGREEDTGRRCVLHPDHMLLMYLERIRHATQQSVLAHAYGISQSSVSRYSDYVEAFLENLPTGDDLAGRINRAPTVAKVQSAATEAVADAEKRPGTPPARPAGPARRCRTTASCATARKFRVRSPKTRTNGRRAIRGKDPRTTS